MCLPPLPVVEDFDVLRDLSACILPGAVATMMDQLGLQRAEEIFHRCVVVAAPLPTHGGNQSKLPEKFLVLP